MLGILQGSFCVGARARASVASDAGGSLAGMAVVVG